jgi:hypothetical protein
MDLRGRIDQESKPGFIGWLLGLVGWKPRKSVEHLGSLSEHPIPPQGTVVLPNQEMQNEHNGVPLEKGTSLEKWLERQNDMQFPKYSSQKAEKPYPQRYQEYKSALLPIHNSVEKSAMAAEIVAWQKETATSGSAIKSDPLVYLNNHGPGHVEMVIDKVSELLQNFKEGHLSPYEGFFLLCAIQTHDIGNVFGRKNHETHCKRILEEKGKPFIPDTFERRVIEKLALVHSGACGDDLDTIQHLPLVKKLNYHNLRKRLLAALLRFGDELADDSSRADREALEQDRIPESSLIYHRYSEALHTVKIGKDSETRRNQIYLVYEFNSDIAMHQFNKNGNQRYLLDEIYDRTLKMERERRYCMRFLRPCLTLDAIRVEITISNLKNPYEYDPITYTLEENGYPIEPSSGKIKEIKSDIRSGKEEMEYLQSKWSL